MKYFLFFFLSFTLSLPVFSKDVCDEVPRFRDDNTMTQILPTFQTSNGDSYTLCMEEAFAFSGALPRKYLVKIDAQKKQTVYRVETSDQENPPARITIGYPNVIDIRTIDRNDLVLITQLEAIEIPGQKSTFDLTLRVQTKDCNETLKLRVEDDV